MENRKTAIRKKLAQARRVFPLHHIVAGRLRAQVEGLYQNEAVKSWLESRLSTLPSIRSVSGNTRTGTLLVSFDPSRTEQEQVVRRIEDALNSDAAKIRKRYVETMLASPQNRRARKRPSAWHVQDAAMLCKKLKTSAHRGLSSHSARLRLKKHGPNRLVEVRGRSEFEIFAAQLNNLPVALLAGSAGVSIVTGGLIDAIAIVSVIAVNAYLGFSTESEAQKTITALIRPKRRKAKVIRSGRLHRVLSHELVPGDILLLEPGSAVPADARLLETSGLSVDEGALTGESLPARKSSETLRGVLVPLGDRRNMVFSGTTVTGGSGKALVVATGASSEMGQVQSLMSETASPKTPMQCQLEAITGKMATISLVASGCVLGLGLVRGHPLLRTLKGSIALAVAAIPEGLPTVATTTLARGVRNLEAHGIFARHLDAVEAFGNIDVICFDKTGTLTLNQMAVKEVRLPQGGPASLRLLQAITLCNESRLGKRRGSSTELALLDFAAGAGVRVDALRARYPLLGTIHRNDEVAMMTTTHEAGDGNQLICAKGNPMEVLGRCTHIYWNQQVLPLGPSDKRDAELANEAMASQALRVLGVAYKESLKMEVSSQHESGLVWLGLVGMSDPLRPGAQRLVKRFQEAGIRTVMLTGDQSATALAVGRQLALARQGKALDLVDSKRIDQVDPTVLRSLVNRAHVFSRVSPAHKLEIVHALQGAGGVVAMIGDGINDGPALKVADLGIAMGRKGTDVARGVADLVLSEDSLESLIYGLEEGRTVHEDIRKAVRYIVSQNLGEILFTFTSIIAGFEEPLSPMQLLWINLVTDIFPEIALAKEPPESDLLRRSPEAVRIPLLANGDMKGLAYQAAVLGTASLGSYLYGVSRYGVGARASTIAFLTLNSASLLHTFSSRSERVSIFDRRHLVPNHSIRTAVGLGLAGELVAAFMPGLRRVLGSGQVGYSDLLLSGAFSLLPFLIIEASKFSEQRLYAPQRSAA